MVFAGLDVEIVILAGFNDGPRIIFLSPTDEARPSLACSVIDILISAHFRGNLVSGSFQDLGAMKIDFTMVGVLDSSSSVLDEHQPD